MAVIRLTLWRTICHYATVQQRPKHWLTQSLSAHSANAWQHLSLWAAARQPPWSPHCVVASPRTTLRSNHNVHITVRSCKTPRCLHRGRILIVFCYSRIANRVLENLPCCVRGRAGRPDHELENCCIWLVTYLKCIYLYAQQAPNVWKIVILIRWPQNYILPLTTGFKYLKNGINLLTASIFTHIILKGFPLNFQLSARHRNFNVSTEIWSLFNTRLVASCEGSSKYPARGAPSYYIGSTDIATQEALQNLICPLCCWN